MRRINLSLTSCLIVLLSCAQVKTTDHVQIDVSPDSIVIEGNNVNVNSVQDELSRVVQARIESGHKRENLIVRLRVNSKTKSGVLADIEVAMRSLNLKKVEYSTYE